jgi:hypothetical protein
VANEVLTPLPSPPANSAYWWHDPKYVHESTHSCCAEA